MLLFLLEDFKFKKSRIAKSKVLNIDQIEVENSSLSTGWLKVLESPWKSWIVLEMVLVLEKHYGKFGDKTKVLKKSLEFDYVL